ncbi:MAG: lysophospholipid acyltransferase family protein [Agathobacter sp.]
MKIRKTINRPWRGLVKCFTKRKIIIENYPKLDKNKAYIFAANHSFDEDATSIISAIDRNAYLLQGSTHQMEHNPMFYAAYLNGMIYVDRLDKQSRKAAVSKMERVLKAGNSVILFPEGGYNNTENQLIMPLFSSPYILSKEMQIEVVPIIAFCKEETREIFIRAGEPMNLGIYEKEEALDHLRDVMSTIEYNIIEEHVAPVKRSELKTDCYRDFLEQRKAVYECQKWYDDVWDEELTYYPGHGVTTPQKAREYVDGVEVNAKNAYVLADTLVRREEDIRHDLKRYLRENLKLSR